MRTIIALLLIIFSPFLQALSLKPNAPSRYLVKPGDTLWEIANRYLYKPWEWREIWDANPQIQNPNRIYPGSTIVLRYKEGKPYLVLMGNGTLKLSPHTRPQPLEKAIPTIPLSNIKPFLNDSQVFSYDELYNAPYVVAFSGEHMIGSAGVKFFAKDLTCMICKRNPSKQSYSLFRPGGVYQEGERILGYIASYLGDAQLLQLGDPSTLILTSARYGVHKGDRLLPSEYFAFSPYFEITAPRVPVSAQVIDFFGGLTQVALYQVIVLDQGKDARLKPGNVVALYHQGNRVKDPVYKREWVQLPNERIGEAMIFKTFRHISYALVMNSLISIHKGDLACNP